MITIIEKAAKLNSVDDVVVCNAMLATLTNLERLLKLKKGTLLDAKNYERTGHSYLFLLTNRDLQLKHVDVLHALKVIEKPVKASVKQHGNEYSAYVVSRDNYNNLVVEYANKSMHKRIHSSIGFVYREDGKLDICFNMLQR